MASTIAAAVRSKPFWKSGTLWNIANFALSLVIAAVVVVNWAVSGYYDYSARLKGLESAIEKLPKDRIALHDDVVKERQSREEFFKDRDQTMAALKARVQALEADTRPPFTPDEKKLVQATGEAVSRLGEEIEKLRLSDRKTAEKIEAIVKALGEIEAALFPKR